MPIVSQAALSNLLVEVLRGNRDDSDALLSRIRSLNPVVSEFVAALLATEPQSASAAVRSAVLVYRLLEIQAEQDAERQRERLAASLN